MAIAYRVVDAFATEPFTGNPAAVCLVDRFLPDDLMQRIAREMNLSETAFAAPRTGSRHALRWFTPAAEVDLCGHATLATAHVLFETGRVEAGGEVRFDTRSGELAVKALSAGRLSMDFPAEPAAACVPPDGLERALGCPVVACGRNRMDLLVEVADEAAVRGLRVDLGLLEAIECRGVIVTARAESGGHDFVSRFFAPRLAVPEDPVTGSAHCALAPWWAERIGRDRLVGWQASARGGRVEVGMRGDRVDLVGSAVTVAEGSIRV